MEDKPQVLISKNNTFKKIIIIACALLLAIAGLSIYLYELNSNKSSNLKTIITSEEKKEIITKSIDGILGSATDYMSKYNELLAIARSLSVTSANEKTILYYEAAIKLLDPAKDSESLDNTYFEVVVFCKSAGLSECEGKYSKLLGQDKLKSMTAEAEKGRYAGVENK